MENPQHPHTASKAGPPQIPIEQLMAKLRSGDRDAAAQFLMRYGSRIRRRIRGKLGPAVRRIFDSMDILSTLGRRLDLYVLSGRLNVVHEEELWSLLYTMADRALIDKARLVRSAQSLEDRNSDFTYESTQRRREAVGCPHNKSEFELDICLHMLPEESDRQLLSLWLLGESSEHIGQKMGITADAARKRLHRLRNVLKERFQTAAA